MKKTPSFDIGYKNKSKIPFTTQLQLLNDTSIIEPIEENLLNISRSENGQKPQNYNIDMFQSEESKTSIFQDKVNDENQKKWPLLVDAIFSNNDNLSKYDSKIENAYEDFQSNKSYPSNFQEKVDIKRVQEPKIENVSAICKKQQILIILY